MHAVLRVAHGHDFLNAEIAHDDGFGGFEIEPRGGDQRRGLGVIIRITQPLSLQLCWSD